VFDARWSEVEVVCKVLAELYKQPKGHYIEVGRDTKSFVLTSKAWDVPTEGQVCLLMSTVSAQAMFTFSTSYTDLMVWVLFRDVFVNFRCIL